MKIFFKILGSAITRSIIGFLGIGAAVAIYPLKETEHLTVPLLMISIPLCLFPLKTTTLKVKNSPSLFTCDKCGERRAVLFVKKHQLVCLILPIVRITYRVEFFMGCEKCYEAEKGNRTKHELKLLLKTGIIHNRKIKLKEYSAAKKGL